MPGMTVAESVATLDARFPTTGGTDYVGYSTDGSTETGVIARTAVGATGWAAATSADPAVKANANQLVSAAATGAATVSHYAVFSAATAGTQRIEWTALTGGSRAVSIGDQLQFAAGSLQITLT